MVQTTNPPGPGPISAINLRRFYETQPEPCIGTELACLLEGRQAVVGCPERWFHLYFPDQPYRDGLRVLVVGCRNLEAARLAAGATRTSFLAIDQDDSALDQLDRLKQHFRLENLEMMWLGADQMPVIDRRFDLVFCPQGPQPPLSPEEFLRLVHGRLTATGSVNMSVGGRHGRLGATLFRRLLETAGIDPDTADVNTIRDWAATLPPRHPFREMAADLPEHGTDDELIEVLRSGEPAFSVPELRTLLDRCGLRLQRFLCQARYVAGCSGFPLEGIRPNEIEDGLHSFALTELFRGDLREHILIACRDDRPAASHTVRFTGREWLDYRPLRNPGLDIEAGHFPGDGVARLSWAAHEDSSISLVVSEKQARLFDLMDGERTISEIVEAAARRDPAADELAREFFQAMWRRDYVWFQIPPAVGPLPGEDLL